MTRDLRLACMDGLFPLLSLSLGSRPPSGRNQGIPSHKGCFNKTKLDLLGIKWNYFDFHRIQLDVAIYYDYYVCVYIRKLRGPHWSTSPYVRKGDHSPKNCLFLRTAIIYPGLPGVRNQNDAWDLSQSNVKNKFRIS